MLAQGADLRVGDVIREHAATRGAAVALRCGSQRLTYGELDERSNRLAQALRGSGVGAGDRVAYLDRTAPEVIELLFAVSKLGAVIVPMNWRLAAPELADVLGDSGARVLIAGSEFTESARELTEGRANGSGGAAELIGVRAPHGYEEGLGAHEPI